MSTEKEKAALLKLTKVELESKAREQGLKLDSRATKETWVNAILEHQIWRRGKKRAHDEDEENTDTESDVEEIIPNPKSRAAPRTNVNTNGNRTAIAAHPSTSTSTTTSTSTSSRRPVPAPSVNTHKRVPSSSTAAAATAANPNKKPAVVSSTSRIPSASSNSRPPTRAATAGPSTSASAARSRTAAPTTTSATSTKNPVGRPRAIPASGSRLTKRVSPPRGTSTRTTNGNSNGNRGPTTAAASAAAAAGSSSRHTRTTSTSSTAGVRRSARKSVSPRKKPTAAAAVEPKVEETDWVPESETEDEPLQIQSQAQAHAQVPSTSPRTSTRTRSAMSSRSPAKPKSLASASASAKKNDYATRVDETSEDEIDVIVQDVRGLRSSGAGKGKGKDKGKGKGKGKAKEVNRPFNLDEVSSDAREEEEEEVEEEEVKTPVARASIAPRPRRSSMPYVEIVTGRSSIAPTSPPGHLPSPPTPPRSALKNGNSVSSRMPATPSSSSRAMKTPSSSTPRSEALLLNSILNSDHYKKFNSRLTALEQNSYNANANSTPSSSSKLAERCKALEREVQAQRLAREALETRLAALELSAGGHNVGRTDSVNQRASDGALESFKANLSALDTFVRALDGRLKQLEGSGGGSSAGEQVGFAAVDAVGEAIVGEVGPPPAPTTGKRTRDEDVGGDGMGAGDSSEIIPPSMEPSPAKRPRVEEEPSAGSAPPAPAPAAGTPSQGQPSTSAAVPVPPSPSPASSSKEAPVVVSPAIPTSVNANANTTPNQKPSPVSTPTSRPFAPMPRRTNSSNKSTSAKMIRTSAISFGQGLVPSTPLNFGGFGGFGGFAPFGSSTPAPGIRVGQEQGMSGDGSPGAGTSVGDTSHVGDQSVGDSSFNQYQYRPPSFSFGASFAPPPPRPFPAAPPASASASGSGPASTSTSASQPQPKLHSASAITDSPAFPVDVGRRHSTDFDDVFGGRVSNSGTTDSPPPPSPSKRTMYGTELTTPLRQELAAERRARYNPALSSLNSGHALGATAGASAGAGVGGTLQETAEEDVEMASASLIADETGSTSFLEGAKDGVFPGANGNGNGSGKEGTPPPSDTSKNQTQDQNQNTSPSRYGLDDPSSWGPRPRQ